jgi:cytochrome b subunit of formate dehydrogenase
MNDVTDENSQGGAGRYITRHRLIDRLFHWITAISVLVLLFTAFLPILGIKFSWVTLHWVSGIVLGLVIFAHIVRSLFWQDLRSMWFGVRDIKETIATLGWLLNLKSGALFKSGKYSPAQKLMHHGVSVLVLVTVITGLLMMVKIDTPFWERDPYWLSDQSWGIVYVSHGLAALFLMSIVMIHIYFSLRPEKLMYLRSMISGWISRTEFMDLHDPQRWRK